MGTFSIAAPTFVGTKSYPGGSNTDWGGGNFGFDVARPTDSPSLLTAIARVAGSLGAFEGWTSNNPTPGTTPSGEWLLRFGWLQSDLVISLDGDPPVSFNTLPSGLSIVSATLRVVVGSYSNVSGDVAAGAGLFLQQGTLIESANLGQVLGATGVQKNFAYDFGVGVLGSFLNVINDGFGIRIVNVTNGSVGQFIRSSSGLFITGVYQDFGFQYTLSPAVVEKNSGPPSGQPNGTPVIITSDPMDPTALDLEHVTITLPCGLPAITVQTTNLIIFFVPSGPCEGDIPVGGDGDGTQFSGSVELGVIHVLATNGSGIYQLTPGQTHDTLYSSLRDGTTRNVKIPNPFGKTGFIGG